MFTNNLLLEDHYDFPAFTENDYPDELFGSKKKKKAAAAANIAMGEKILASGQQLSNAQMQAMILSADGKVSKRDKQLIKNASKTDRVEARAETKQIRATEKFKSKTDPAVTESQYTEPNPSLGTMPTTYDSTQAPTINGGYSDISSGSQAYYPETSGGYSSSPSLEDYGGGGLEEGLSEGFKEKTMQGVTVTDKKKKNIVFIIIGAVVLLGLAYYFSKSKK